MRAKEKLYKHLPRPKLNRTKINEIYQRLQNLDPAPRTELNYTNVFTLVVAVALSAQSTDIGVNKATKRLFELADTPQKMMSLAKIQFATISKL
jgi:endonuclease-3